VDDPRTIQAAHAGQSDYQKHSSRAAFEKSQHPLIDDVARVGETPLVWRQRPFLFLLLLYLRLEICITHAKF
jgi:hypothetical protein